MRVARGLCVDRSPAEKNKQTHRHKVQIGPVWINSPLIMQERYDTKTQQYVPRTLLFSFTLCIYTHTHSTHTPTFKPLTGGSSTSRARPW